MKQHSILFLAANPEGTSRLALDEEARAIEDELARAGARDRFELVTRWAVRPLDLLHHLQKLKPSIVHFSGHGSRSDSPAAAGARDVQVPAAAGPSLRLHGAGSANAAVSGEALAAAFAAADPSVQLVVLNACYSDELAEPLLEHVSCVIGMSGAVQDAAARCFSVGFYGGLANELSIKRAFLSGRAAIVLAGHRDKELPKLRARPGGNAEDARLASATWIPSAGLADVAYAVVGSLPLLQDLARDKLLRVAGVLSEIEACLSEMLVAADASSPRERHESLTRHCMALTSYLHYFDQLDLGPVLASERATLARLLATAELSRGIVAAGGAHNSVAMELYEAVEQSRNGPRLEIHKAMGAFRAAASILRATA